MTTIIINDNTIENSAKMVALPPPLPLQKLKALTNCKTKVALKSHFHNLIEKIGCCQSVKTKYPAHYAEFIALLQCHPEAHRFLVVIDIKIKKNRRFKHLELHTLLENGYCGAVSYLLCISGKQKTAGNLLKEAMRSSIVSQLFRFRSRVGKPQCEFCKTIDGDFHVDHIILFENLYQDFLKDNKIKLPTEFYRKRGNLTGFKKSGEEFKKAWNAYHKKNAQLRFLCKKCNLTRKKT